MSLNKKNSNFIIHFIGIGGIGMSGIAELMLDQGYIIQGSDLVFNTSIKRLKDRGVMELELMVFVIELYHLLSQLQI